LTVVSLPATLFLVSKQDALSHTIDEPEIGRNIRRLREASGLTLTDAAEKAKLSKGALSKIENGQNSPPIATLIRIAKVIRVPLARFFAMEDINPPYVFTPKGSGRHTPMHGSKFGYAYEALGLGKEDKRAEPFLLTIRPEDPEGSFYHEGQEFIHMLTGKMSFIIGGDELVLRAGDSLYFDSEVTHRTRAMGTAPAKFICIFIS
jgi:transcriptional regulator with XRE-family HTH domain